MDKARILIVEDEAILAMSLENKLDKLGYVILQPVATGEDAIAAVEDEQPDLVLMDIQLAGDMDGITAAGRINSFSDVPIVYLTGHSDEPLVQRAMLTSTYGYLIKPVSIEDLRVSLKVTLHQHVLDKKLQQSEARYRNIVENINDALFIHDFNGRISDVNENACRLLGYERSDLIGQDLALISSPEGICHCPGRMNILRNDPRIVFETNCVRKDGTQIPVEFSSKVVSREAAGVIQAFVRDISERKQYEREIIHKNEQLQKALTERDKFFSIIAHDLRSPLIGFLFFIKTMTEKIHKFSPEKLQRLSKEMHNSAENLYNLLENLLKWSLVQRGETDYTPVVCDLTDHVGKNIDLMLNVAVHKNISFNCYVPENLKVSADKSMLDTILRNLLTNAVKFSQSNGVVSVSAELHESMVMVSVEDKGIGMDQELLSRLFTLSKISSRKGTAQEKGTGLGLVLCREFVQKHGGEIWAKSKQGQGSTFYFTLPAYETDSGTDD
jgi:PAS domain S-box-containing protein